MHNRALHDILAAFVEEAAWQLAEEVSGGAEVPFEVIEQGRAVRAPVLLPPADPALHRRARRLARPPAELRGRRPGPRRRCPTFPPTSRRAAAAAGSDPRSLADAALQAFICAMWADATDFTYDAQRFAAAYEELEEAAYAGCALSVVVTPVDGLVIESDEVALGDGLTLVRGVRLRDAPHELRGDEFATVAVLALEEAPGGDAGLEHAGRRLRHLQTALRLWDDAEPALGPTAWARTDGGPWMAIPLATGLRRDAGDCLVSLEDEDPLRAFCALVARRTPRAGELAWALRRFELGCERGSALEALTDWLLPPARCSPSPTPSATSGCASGSRRSARCPRTASRWSTGSGAPSRSSGRSWPGSSAPTRSSKCWWPSSAPACGRCCGTCSAATSSRSSAGWRTRCWPTSPRWRRPADPRGNRVGPARVHPP